MSMFGVDVEMMRLRKVWLPVHNTTNNCDYANSQHILEIQMKRIICKYLRITTYYLPIV